MLGLEVLLVVLAVVRMVAETVVGGTIANLIGGDVSPYSLSALVLALFVGIAQAVLTVLVSVMLARIYAQLAGRDAAVSVPSSGT
jgi:hypothetical protein